MFFSRAWNAIVRATAALLLAMAFVTPALAEIGCVEESIVHLQDSYGSGAGEQAASDPAEPDDESRTGQPDHCAFNHGHCAGLLTTTARTEQSLSHSDRYMRLAARPLTANALDAPERPPSA